VDNQRRTEAGIRQKKASRYCRCKGTRGDRDYSKDANGMTEETMMGEIGLDNQEPEKSKGWVEKHKIARLEELEAKCWIGLKTEA
jgi:hypothetical protein